VFCRGSGCGEFRLRVTRGQPISELPIPDDVKALALPALRHRVVLSPAAEIDGRRVDDVISGYAGGTKETAKYDIVSTGRTGHAEAVLITHDPKRMSYGQLLKIFFSVAHDPTQLNQQGPDHGRQYF
jgi:hypothetical protein